VPRTTDLSGIAGPVVSVIIPAHNAQSTLERTLQSLIDQTFRDWEAIVVDDGSTDATARIAEQVIATDDRIKLIQQPAGGVSRARNNGLSVARGGWVLFLDADDLITSQYMTRMLAETDRDPFCQAIVCGYARVTPDGRIFDQYSAPGGDLFPLLAQTCVFAIHACMLRRSLIVEAGAFDPALKTCEDWDLWQRIARSGVMFHSVPDVMAHYCMRAMSASTDATRMLHDAKRLLEQGHSPDPRVKNAAPASANGMPRHLLPAAQLYSVVWPAGLLIGQKRDAREVLHHLKGCRETHLDAEGIARTLFTAALLPTCAHPSTWAQRWRDVEKLVDAFLEELEAISGTKSLARRVKSALARLVIDAQASTEPCALGDFYAIRIELTEPVADVKVDGNSQRLLCLVQARGKRIGVVELPVCDGLVPAAVIADTIAAEHGWEILWHFFDATVYRSLHLTETRDGTTIRRGDVVLAEAVLETDRGAWPRWHDRVGWIVFMQELWGKPEWTARQFYRGTRAQAATSLHCREPVSLELTQLPREKRLPRPDCAVTFTLGGEPLAVVNLACREPVLAEDDVIATVNTLVGTELLRAAVRDAIIGRPFDDGRSLRQRLGDRIATKQNFSASSMRFARHPTARMGTGTLRRAALPTAAIDALSSAAKITGQLIFTPQPPQAANAVLYDPGILGAAPDSALKKALAGFDALQRRIARRWKRPQITQLPPSSAATSRLPILMYHRVAPHGAERTSRWRVTPDEFESQLKWMREAGFYSTSFEDWHGYAESKTPMPGRAVIVTFDDGYDDFHHYAWPLLERYGFSAYVFLVADCIGQTNRWDADLGESLPLMSWRKIRYLQKRGIRFGSHTCTHPLLTGLDHAQVVSELARSVATLTKGLGQPVTSLAYPFGDHDAITAHFAGACGMNFAVTCRSAAACFTDSMLMLPRIEVIGGAGSKEFIARMNP
jgi:peptidoglycan/xylan/chitin deacetylase (PgdA/CDA1 family)/GT2 family glycosyltransferase